MTSLEPASPSGSTASGLRNLGRLPGGAMRRRALVALLTAGVLALTLTPIGTLLVGSLRDAPPGAADAQWTLAGWQRAFSEAATYRTLWTSIWLATIATGISTALAVFFAWVVARTDTPGARYLERLLIAPLFVPSILLALSWGVIAGRTGTLNQLLERIPLVGPSVLNMFSAPGLIFVFVLAITPLTFMLILPSFKSMSHELEEAGRSLGASRWVTARKVTFPLMAPAIFAGATLSAVKVIESLELPILLGRPADIDVFMTRIYFSIRFNPTPDYAKATALAVIIILITAALVILQTRYTSKRSFATVVGKGGRLEVARLGRIRYVTAAACWSYLLLSLILPIGVLILGSFERFIGQHSIDALTTRHWREAWRDDVFITTLENTIVLALAASFAVALVSACVAYVITRSKSRLKWVLDGASWAPWGVPGTVLGLGTLWAFALLPGQLHLTRWGLLLAYMVLLLPLGVRTYSSGFMQIHVELEEAGYASGAGNLRIALRILSPLLVRTTATALLFTVVLVVREVGVPAILAARGNEMLGSLTLDAWLRGQASRAAVYGVVMMALSGAALALHFIAERVLDRRRPGSAVIPDIPRVESSHHE